jgi:hypothetical protein
MQELGAGRQLAELPGSCNNGKAARKEAPSCSWGANLGTTMGFSLCLPLNSTIHDTEAQYIAVAGRDHS